MRILIHLCCGPCGIMPVQRLREEGHTLTGVFHNPNIHPLSEYLRRREAVLEMARRLDLPLIFSDQDEGPEAWNLARWLAAVHDKNLVPGGPEHESRCAFCYRDRLGYVAALAARQGFDALCTSLLYSRMQRHDRIRTEGEATAAAAGTMFLYRDFRPDWDAGIALSRSWDLFRQNYCGCVYSEAERFRNKYDKVRTRPVNQS